jgi:hypothetical protein
MGTEEDPVGIDAGTHLHQVLDQCVPRVLGQRQANLFASFTKNADRAATPIEITEPHGRDVAGTESKPGQQKENGSVPDSTWLAQVAGGDQTLDIVRFEVPR